MPFRSFLLAAVCFLSPVAATAQEATTCVTQDADLPAELAGWPAKISLTAASGAPGLSQAALTPGQAYLATLASTSAVTYLAPPEKPGDPATHGGLFDLTVPTAGTYVVALGAAGWIDLLRDGASVPSAFHSHGPACSTVRKIVGFELQPGRYGVQIAGSVPAILPIMVAKRP